MGEFHVRLTMMRRFPKLGCGVPEGTVTDMAGVIGTEVIRRESKQKTGTGHNAYFYSYGPTTRFWWHG